MKSKIYFLIIIAIFILATSAFGEIIGINDKEIQPISDLVLDNILKGIKTDNYDKYSKDFDETMKKAETPKQFRESNKQLRNIFGNYQQRTYLGFLNQSKMTIVLWKARFDGTGNDVLIKLVISKRADKYLVTGLWFQ